MKVKDGTGGKRTTLGLPCLRPFAAPVDIQTNVQQDVIAMVDTDDMDNSRLPKAARERPFRTHLPASESRPTAKYLGALVKEVCMRVCVVMVSPRSLRRGSVC